VLAIGNVFLALAEVKHATPSSIFTFAVLYSSLPTMTNLWFSATYYYGVFGYNRWGPGSRVR
jgi:hypothetical protein